MTHVFQTTPPVFLLVCSKKKVSQFSVLQPNDFSTLLHYYHNTGKVFHAENNRQRVPKSKEFEPFRLTE